MDNYITFNKIVYLDIILDLEILKFDEKLIFTIGFRKYEDKFFKTAVILLAKLTMKVSI